MIESDAPDEADGSVAAVAASVTYGNALIEGGGGVKRHLLSASRPYI